MKRYLNATGFLPVVLLFSLLLNIADLSAQCVNADFSTGDFTGWTATYDHCSGGVVFGHDCVCAGANPTANAGFLQGPLNAPSNSATQYSQTICSSGNDANMASLGVNIPCVYPGNTYSARLGSTFAAAEGETLTYGFTVTPNNCNFTYHYAVVLEDGGHAANIAPYFHINVVDGSGNPITCANFAVDGSDATAIGFDSVPNGGTTVHYKNWTSVFVPLNAFIGQTVQITFTTASCYPPGTGCGGPHYAYAYIAAECGPLQILSSSPTVCGGQNVTLTAPPGAASYLWSGPGVVAPLNAQTVVITQPGHYTCNMTTFGNPPCPFSLDTVVPPSPSNPSANFSATTACAGSPTIFTDMSTPGGGVNAWAWDFDNNGTVDTTAQNPQHTFATAGVYPVKLTITWPPCTADTTISVTVVAPPTSTFSVTSPVCEGTNATITYTGNGAVGDTYTWSFDGGTVVSGTGQGPYSVNWSTGGTKNVTLTVIAGSCSSTQTIVPVVVNPFPGVTVTPDTSICTSGSVVLTATGATSYTWTPATGLSATTGSFVTANPAATTTYTVTGVSANCTSPASVTVTVNPIPTSTFLATSPVCTGVNSTITYTGNAPANANYTWGFSGGTVASGTGQGPYQVNWAGGGTQNVTLIVSQSGCSSTLSTVPVTVNTAPTSTFTATPVCTGQNSTITYTGNGPGGATYTWSFAGGTVVSGAGQGPYQVSWATAGTENVTLSVTNNGCTSVLTTVPVTVIDVPTSTFTVTTPVCTGQNDPITYTGNAPGTATYTWSFAGGTTVSGTGQGPYQVSWGTAGPENVTLSVTNNGCSSTLTTVPVTVNLTPTSAFTVVSPVCAGQNSTITYTGNDAVSGTAAYTWSFAGGTVISGVNAGPYQVNWATAGTENVTLSMTDNGCSSQLTTVPVVVNAIPTASFTASSPVCTGTSSTLTYTGSATVAATYSWGFAGGTVVTGSGQGPYQVNWAAAGTENVTLSVTENGCSSTSDTVGVTVNAIPVSDAGADTGFCSGLNATIGAASTAGYTYSWSPATGLSDPTISNPLAAPVNTTSAVEEFNYVVTTSQGNCSSTDTVTITVSPVPVAAFTPPAGQCETGNSFNLTAGGTFLPGAAFAWNFGANATPAASTSQNPAVSFTAPGAQAVSLTITQSGCTSNVFVDSVQVYLMPASSFPASAVTQCENFQVCFTNNSVSIDPSVYLWSFGDGETSSQQNPCHTYGPPGVYTVALKVTSADGCSGDTIAPNMVTIIADPRASFTANPSTIQLPVNTISLQNHSQFASTYLWTFGSAGSSTDINPQVVFTDSGTYNIVLRAYNILGCVDSTELPVTVFAPDAFFIPNIFSPNGDGHNDEFYIYSQAGVKVLGFEVFDRWGEKVHDGAYPWDGSYRGKPAPNGVYVYIFKLGLGQDNLSDLRQGSVTLVEVG